MSSEFSIQPIESQWVQTLIHGYSHFPLHKTHLKTGKQFFCTVRGAVAYEMHLGQFVVAGDPLVFERKDADRLVKDFVSWAHSLGVSVCGYYFSQDLAFRLSTEFSSYHAGVSHFIDLKNFTWSGYRKRDVRRALNQGQRGRLIFGEIPKAEKRKWQPFVDNLICRWKKKRSGPTIQFLLSAPKWQYPGADEERWFIVTDSEGKKIHAMVSTFSYATTEGRGIYVDHLVQDPSGNRFALDFLLVQLSIQMQREAVSEMSLGLSAFKNLSGTRPVDRLLRFIGKRERIYNSQGIYRFKRKFSTTERPRFLLLDRKRGAVLQLAALIKATYPQAFNFRFWEKADHPFQLKCPRQWRPKFLQHQNPAYRN